MWEDLNLFKCTVLLLQSFPKTPKVFRGWFCGELRKRVLTVVERQVPVRFYIPHLSRQQIGKGFTNQGQVLVGAAGGTVYRTQPNQRNITRWEVTVHMDDGSTRALTQNYEPLMQVGDRVRVFGTQIELVQ